MKKLTITFLAAIVLLTAVAQAASAATVDWNTPLLDLGTVAPGSSVSGSAQVISTGANANVMIIEELMFGQYVGMDFINITSPPRVEGLWYDHVLIGDMGDGERVDVQFKCAPPANKPEGTYWSVFLLNSTQGIPGDWVNVTCNVSQPQPQPQCNGAVRLALTPNPARKGETVKANVYGLNSECRGKDALIKFQDYSRGPTVAQCTIGSSGSCTTNFRAPTGKAGYYRYFALVDKNSDGQYKFNEGEIGLAILKVLGWGWGSWWP